MIYFRFESTFGQIDSSSSSSSELASFTPSNTNRSLQTSDNDAKEATVTKVDDQNYLSDDTSQHVTKLSGAVRIRSDSKEDEHEADNNTQKKVKLDPHSPVESIVESQNLIVPNPSLHLIPNSVRIMEVASFLAGINSKSSDDESISFHYKEYDSISAKFSKYPNIDDFTTPCNHISETSEPPEIHLTSSASMSSYDTSSSETFVSSNRKLLSQKAVVKLNPVDKQLLHATKVHYT